MDVQLKLHKLFFVIFVLAQIFRFNFLASQNHGFGWPIDSPFVVTGNYGEIRPNHFHSGLDFSTSGKVNLPVFAVKDGYVSRIRVSSVGYGRSVYITHPDGLVSVYAHLNSFNLKIDQAIKKQMLTQKIYEIDYYTTDRSLTVKKNEIVGLSGNTGGSTGPHLHFELRDQKTEVPYNPLNYYKINDVMAPTLNQIAIYDLSDTLQPKIQQVLKIKSFADNLIVDPKVVRCSAIVGIAFSGFDRFNKNSNPNNIYAAKCYFDNKLVYYHLLDSIEFSDARYVNEFSELYNRNKFQKCFLPQIFPKNFYKVAIDKGRIILHDTMVHKIQIEVFDESGNTSNIQFYLQSTTSVTYKSNKGLGLYVDCTKSNLFRESGMLINIPKGTFYNSCGLQIKNASESTGVISFEANEANVNTPISLTLPVPSKHAKYKDKLVLRSKTATVNLNVRNDSLSFQIKNLDVYQIKVDTVAPVLKVKVRSSKNKSDWDALSCAFTMTDNLSGINKYNLFLNDTWVLAYYDAKNNLLTYYFDETTPKGFLNFKLEVEDRVGNKSTIYHLLKN